MLSGKLRKGGGDEMSWWAYRLAQGAGYSRWNAFRSAYLNQDVPDRTAEIEAEREATIARIEKLDPEYAAKLRRDGMI
jgi:hypothetical protein